MNEKSSEIRTEDDSLPTGVSMENASYIDTFSDNTNISKDDNPSLNPELSNEDEEHTPQLFSDENDIEGDNNLDEFSENKTSKLFDQDINEDDEDFEIPAFLRKQKF